MIITIIEKTRSGLTPTHKSIYDKVGSFTIEQVDKDVKRIVITAAKEGKSGEKGKMTIDTDAEIIGININFEI